METVRVELGREREPGTQMWRGWERIVLGNRRGRGGPEPCWLLHDNNLAAKILCSQCHVKHMGSAL